MKTIPLTKGAVALVDDADFDSLAKHKWHITSAGYAARNIRLESGKQTLLLMHREINSTPSGALTDHRNCNKLDNQRANLRVCDRAQNSWNRGPQRNNLSRIKGVTFVKRDNRYWATIYPNGQALFLGSFKSPTDAELARVGAAKRLHGEFFRA